MVVCAYDEGKIDTKEEYEATIKTDKENIILFFLLSKTIAPIQPIWNLKLSII